MSLANGRTTRDIEFAQLPPESRVWIYGARERLTPQQVEALGAHMTGFLEEWRSHGREVTPGWELVHDQFLVIAVDERAMHVSGCSIDSMFRAVEAFGQATRLDFSRSGNHVFYRNPNNGIERIDRPAFAGLVRQGLVSAETIVFDNTIALLADFRNGRWEVPVRRSWHMKAFAKFLGAEA